MPPIHPAVVHFPITLLIIASAFGLAYLHWQPRPELKLLTWWSMFLGWLSLPVAILSGIVSQGGLPPDAPYRGLLNLHITTGLALVVVYGDLLYRRWLHNSGKGKKRRLGERPRARANDEPIIEFMDEPGRKWLITIQLLIGILLVIASGYLGGELVYTWGVNVRG